METKEFKSFFKTVGGNEGDKCNYTTRLDTYGCGCQHDCKFCLDPDTPIMMFDGTQKKLKDVQIGDEIYGIVQGDSYKEYSKAVVTNKWYVNKEAYKITLEDGRVVVCSGDHRWLTNRGWKYTVGDMVGDNRRPYLTTNNEILGLSGFKYYNLEETDDYKRGYICGITSGDGNIGIYSYEPRIGHKNQDVQHHFRIVMNETKAVERTAKYLADFGVCVQWFDFPVKQRKTGEVVNRRAIRTSSKSNYFIIKDIVDNIQEDNEEWLRGYFAGFYDAEGTTNKLTKRYFNKDEKLMHIARTALSNFGFEWTEDKSEKGIYTDTVIGGVGTFAKMMCVFNFATDKFSFDGIRLKSDTDGRKIVSIEPVGKMELVDISTTTENFIANGLVSHNCYAKSLLDFRKLWNPDNPSIADIEKIRRKIAKLPKDTPAIRLGGMTDCFQPLEKEYRITYETIKALNENRIPYLIVTKSSMVADDEYVEILDKELAHIQITVTTTDDELCATYEKATPPSERIKAIEKLQSLGFDVQLRLSPFIPEYVDYNVLNNVKCDKILIEFLRANTWIKKWFDVDYSEHTIKQSGYSHLPLKKKIEYINNINGFKEMSVCEDESEAYEYWKKYFNHNQNDCCNLR